MPSSALGYRRPSTRFRTFASNGVPEHGPDPLQPAESDQDRLYGSHGLRPHGKETNVWPMPGTLDAHADRGHAELAERAPPTLVTKATKRILCTASSHVLQHAFAAVLRLRTARWSCLERQNAMRTCSRRN